MDPKIRALIVDFIDCVEAYAPEHILKSEGGSTNELLKQARNILGSDENAGSENG